MAEGHGDRVLGAEMPAGVRFVGPETEVVPRWRPGDHPAQEDLDRCVACGLCLPHCPTYRLTGEESASPRGRITAMRAVAEGRAEVDRRFAEFMDLCLVCRACEDACPSLVPFGRMMERARVQIEPLRPARAKFVRRVGLGLVLSRGWLLTLATALTPLARPLLPRRLRALLPRVPLADLRRPLPSVTEPVGKARGTVALLAGCVADRWFREVNRATARVLARNGWRVIVPRGQGCCGALAAHFGQFRAARRMARRNLAPFRDADWVVVNAAGCSAHMKQYPELLGEEAAGLSERVRDLMEFLHEQGIEPPTADAGVGRVAYHDACHARWAQGIHEQPRGLLRQVPGLKLVEIPDDSRCCGAGGVYNVLEPELADRLMTQKVEAVVATRAEVVASANPGCTLQILAGLRAMGRGTEVLHPVEILDRAYRAEARAEAAVAG